MFTLCGLILEARENLFRNFSSPFSISFYFSSERNYLKKTAEPTMGRTRPGLRLAGAFISRGKPARRPSRPETLAAPSPSPAAASRRRRPDADPLEPLPPPPTIPPPKIRCASFFVPKKEKKNWRSSFFFFSD